MVILIGLVSSDFYFDLCWTRWNHIKPTSQRVYVIQIDGWVFPMCKYTDFVLLVGVAPFAKKCDLDMLIT